MRIGVAGLVDGATKHLRNSKLLSINVSTPRHVKGKLKKVSVKAKISMKQKPPSKRR